MSKAIHRRQKARQDLVDIYRYYMHGKLGYVLPGVSSPRPNPLSPDWLTCQGSAAATSTIIPHSLACVSFLSPASEDTLSSTDPLPTASRLWACCTERATSTSSWRTSSASRKTPTAMRKKKIGNDGPVGSELVRAGSPDLPVLCDRSPRPSARHLETFGRPKGGVGRPRRTKGRRAGSGDPRRTKGRRAGSGDPRRTKGRRAGSGDPRRTEPEVPSAKSAIAISNVLVDQGRRVGQDFEPRHVEEMVG